MLQFLSPYSLVNLRVAFSSVMMILYSVRYEAAAENHEKIHLHLIAANFNILVLILLNEK